MNSPTPQEFIKAYKAAVDRGEGPKWVARELGVDVSVVHSRATRYRKMGIKIPYADTKGPRTIFTDDLNDILGS
jgi:hypothetical protein